MFEQNAYCKQMHKINKKLKHLTKQSLSVGKSHKMMEVKITLKINFTISH